jgi:hypothetical protein
MRKVMKSMIATQEKALEPQREPIAATMTDAVTAQNQGLSAIEAGAKAWRNLFELRSIKP